MERYDVLHVSAADLAALPLVRLDHAVTEESMKWLGIPRMLTASLPASSGIA